jgi:hypothetical protein
LTVLIDRIIEKLHAIQTSEDYDKNIKTYELLDQIIKKIDDDTNKVIIFQKILDLVEGDSFGEKYFLPKLATYTTWNPIKKMIVETEGYLYRIIKLYSKSSSFYEAKMYSALLENFINNYSRSQVQSIVTFFLKNDQINYSWGAQRNMRSIFNKYSEWISPQELDELKKHVNIDA